MGITKKIEKLPDVLSELRRLSTRRNLEGMKRFGITGKKILGVSVTDLRKLARRISKSHKLAEQLWKTGIHEARVLAGIVEEKEKVTEKQMDNWIKGFDSWDIVDQTCLNLFCYHPRAFWKAKEWIKREKD